MGTSVSISNNGRSRRQGEFSEFLCQGLQDMETLLIEEQEIDEEIAEQHTERIVGILDEILEHPDITDEAIENSDDDVIDIIYDAITA